MQTPVPSIRKTDVITFYFQRQFPNVPAVSKGVIDLSPDLQINILFEFIWGGGGCAVSNVKRTQLIWLMDGSKCSPGPEGDLQEKCTVPYNTHKNAHINIPSRWVPLASSRAHCVDAHVCARTPACTSFRWVQNDLNLKSDALTNILSGCISTLVFSNANEKLFLKHIRSYCCDLFH